MNLRDFIDQLEELSENGKNDDMDVYTYEGWPINEAYIIDNDHIELES